jgi:hypothetical protein
VSAEQTTREQGPTGTGGAVPGRAPASPRIGPGLADGLALAALVAVSLAAFLGRLGFASDDWDFLRAMTFAPEQSVAGSFEALDANPNIHPRPVQALYQAVLFALFGDRPLGYHLAGAALLLAAVLLLHLVLRELGVPRLMAVAVPALFAVFPSYATDRLWFAAHGYLLALAACFLSLYAGLRAVRATGPRRWAWAALALAALLVSALGYEIAIPFLAAGVPLVAWRARGLGRGHALALVAPNVAALAAIMAFKLAASPGAHLSQSVPEHLARLFGGAALVSFGSYGAGLPLAAGWALGVAEPAGIALTLAATGAAFAYLWRLHGAGEGIGRRGWLLLAAAGVPVFLLGYAVFLATSRFILTSTGIGNRWQAAGAVGAAMVLVGLLGWLAGLAPPRLRRGATSGLLAVAIGASVLVGNGLGAQWVEAREARDGAVAGIAKALPSPAPDTTVILEGVCPYVGAAIVADSDWDLAGALRLRYGRPDLHADVATTGRLSVGESGLVGRHYGREVRYPFGPALLAYDGATGELTPLADRATALAALEPTACPSGGEGRGVPVLPLDRRIGALGG